MIIRQVQQRDAQALSQYYLKNRQHFRPWEPRTSVAYHHVSEWESRLRERVTEQENKKAAYFIAFEDTDKIIGHCTLSQICYGSFMACYMGYAISRACEGRGMMDRICRHAIEHAFIDLGLHRIMANYMPHNNRSAKLLKRLGFVIEGKADNYLKIDGAWENHILTSLTNTRKL